MEHRIQVGMTYQVAQKVTADNTASAFGSGGIEVFATPCMILYMEQAAMMAVEEYLAEGCTTVGTRVDIEHCAATPIGMAVTAKATLREIDGRRLIYDVEARDEKELIGRGTHERFIIDKDRFMAKINSK